MDAGTHLRAIWRRRWYVLGGALLLALAVLGLRAAQVPQWTAEATLFVVPGGDAGRDVTRDVQRLALTYAELATADEVLTDVAGELVATTASQVGDETTVTATEDGEVLVVAAARTASGAAQLANALGDALSAAADREQQRSLQRDLRPLEAELTSLRSQLAGNPDNAQLAGRLEALEQARLDRLGIAPARLDVVAQARAHAAERVPEPLRDAAYAGVLALILLAELAALVATRRGGIEGRDALTVVRSWTGVPAFRAGRGRHGGDQGLAAVLHVASGLPAGAPVVLALASAAQPAHLGIAVRSILASGTVLYGPATLVDLRLDAADDQVAGLADSVDVVRDPHVDLSALGTDATSTRPSRDLTVIVADAWDDPDLLLVTRTMRAVTVLVLDAGTARRRVVREAVETLATLRTAPVATLVVAVDRAEFTVFEYDQDAEAVAHVPRRVTPVRARSAEVGADIKAG
jgi:hypothetical protein